MIYATQIARLDGLMLCADEGNDQALDEIKSQIKQVLRRLNRNSEAQATVEAGQYTFQYVDDFLQPQLEFVWRMADYSGVYRTSIGIRSAETISGQTKWHVWNGEELKNVSGSSWHSLPNGTVLLMSGYPAQSFRSQPALRSGRFRVHENLLELRISIEVSKKSAWDKVSLVSKLQGSFLDVPVL